MKHSGAGGGEGEMRRTGAVSGPRVSPDGDAGVVGDAARHDGLRPLDDALVLRRLGDAGASCRHTSSHGGMSASRIE